MTAQSRSNKLSESILEELWFGEDDTQKTDEQAAASLAAVMADLEGLRPFSDVARKVMEQVSDPDFDVGRLKSVIEQDPALATKVLRMANSAAFRPREPCGTIRQAIMVLGARTLGELAMSLSMMTMFSDVGGLGRTVRDHCASTGAMVRVMSVEVANAVSSSYLVGLLHDFGKLLLLQAQPATYVHIDGSAIVDPDGVYVREREALGYDHAVLGAHMLRKWGLPDPIPKIIAWHHQPSRAYGIDDTVSLQVALIRLADRLDLMMRGSNDITDADLDRLAAMADCQYLGFRGRDLRRMWNDLGQAQRESQQLFR